MTTSPDRFWALTESLLRDGYLPTETIIVLKTKGSMIVKEGIAGSVRCGYSAGSLSK